MRLNLGLAASAGLAVIAVSAILPNPELRGFSAGVDSAEASASVTRFAPSISVPMFVASESAPLDTAFRPLTSDGQ